MPEVYSLGGIQREDRVLALKRSTARNIFIAGSFLCFVGLLALTADFHSVVAERTNEKEKALNCFRAFADLQGLEP